MLTGTMSGRPPLLLITSICAVLSAAVIGVFCLTAEAEGDRDLMVKVDTPSPGVWLLLHSLDARLHFRGDGYAVVSLDSGALKALDENGLTWSPLPRDPETSLFYVIPEKGTAPVPSLGFKILSADEDGALVAVSDREALDARLGGYKVMPLDKAWPVWGSGFVDLDFVHDDVTVNEGFRRIVRRVSADSLAANIRHLEDYGTRYAYTQQTLAAGTWLLKRLWNYGYTDTLLQAVSIDPKVSIAPGNVVATKPGSTRPEFRILVGGHYDSIVGGGSAAAAKKAPGADDNASGTAAALEIARLLAGVELDATVQFVLFTAEELGLLGSREFVTLLAREEFPTDNLFFINMDMIGNADTLPWKTRIYFNDRSKALAELMEGVGKVYSSTTPVLPGSMGRSDHASFWQLGYPAVFVHENDFSPDYHSVDDLLINLEMDYEAEVVKMVLATVLHLASAADPPANLVASATESGGVSLQWSHSLDADVLGYRVETIGGAGEVTSSVFTTDNFAVLSHDNLFDAAWVRVRAEDILGEGEPSEAVLIGTGSRLIVEALPSLTSGGAKFSVFVPGVGPAADASARVVDVAGRLVTTLHDGPLDRGSISFPWNGTFSGGDRVPAGVYFFVVDAAGVGTSSAKVIVVR